ncbi:MAG: Acyl-homoserine lactone [Rhodocyclales bacterium]|nr:Acyl-homoserine lactone [Rhodocyclales bacterium]
MLIQKKTYETKKFQLAAVLAAAALMLVSAPTFAQTKLVIPTANVTASADDGKGNVAALANDNDINTHWSADATSGAQWLQFNLGSCQKVAYVKVGWYNGNLRKYAFSVQTSKDGGATWTTALSTTSDGTTSSRVIYDFSDVSSTLVRLVSTGSNVSKMVSVSEMEVWSLGAGACGTASSSSSSSSAASSSSSSSSSVSSSSSSSSSSTSSAQYPAQLLGGLKPWKLTLPTGPSNSADTILQPALATYSNSPWFTLNSTKTAVNFRANAGGSRTSTNTAYARTELREMDSTGANPAAWSCASATRSMHIEQALLHTTTVKPEASIGQIHDDTNDNLMLLYTGPSGANGSTDTGTFVAYFNNRASSVTLDSAYKLGDKMVVDVKVTGGTVDVKYQNLRSGKITDSGANSLTGVSGSCYFKSGMYIASCSTTDSNGSTNTACVGKNLSAYDTASAYSEVGISKLTLQ